MPNTSQPQTDDELTYHGRPLNPQPTDETLTLGEIARRLVAGTAVTVTLEPGDMTRYDLTIAPVRSWHGVLERLAVVRSTGSGGDFRSAALLPNPANSDELYVEEEVHRLGAENTWSAQLFLWWFGKLWERITEAEAGR